MSAMVPRTPTQQPSHGRPSLTQHYGTFSGEYKKVGAARGANENV